MSIGLRVLAVASGKGGVGKTSIAVSLSIGLKKLEKNVGLIDLDLNCPTTLRAIGIDQPQSVEFVGGGQAMLKPIIYEGIPIFSQAMLAPLNVPILWSGEMRARFIKDSINVVQWGSELEYLVVDLPASTSDDAHQAFTDLGTEKKPDGGILVTMPDTLSLEIYRRAKAMLAQYQIPLLVTVLNKSGFRCEHGTFYPIFGDPTTIEGTVYEVPISMTTARTRIIENPEKLASLVIKRLGE